MSGHHAICNPNPQAHRVMSDAGRATTGFRRMKAVLFFLLFTIVPFVAAAGGKIADHLTRAAVEDALDLDSRVPAGSVVPEVREDHVVLNGIVANDQAREAAEQDARNTIGVRTVENRIRVLLPADD